MCVNWSSWKEPHVVNDVGIINANRRLGGVKCHTFESFMIDYACLRWVPFECSNWGVATCSTRRHEDTRHNFSHTWKDMKLIIGKSFISKGPTIETVVCLSDSLLLKGKMSKPQKDFKHAIESKKFPCGRGEFSSTISMPIVALVRKTSSKTSLRSNGHKHKQEPSQAECFILHK